MECEEGVTIDNRKDCASHGRKWDPILTNAHEHIFCISPILSIYRRIFPLGKHSLHAQVEKRLLGYLYVDNLAMMTIMYAFVTGHGYNAMYKSLKGGLRIFYALCIISLLCKFYIKCNKI